MEDPDAIAAGDDAVEAEPTDGIRHRLSRLAIEEYDRSRERATVETVVNHADETRQPNDRPPR
jgi:hypothetical protein